MIFPSDALTNTSTAGRFEAALLGDTRQMAVFVFNIVAAGLE